MTNVIHAAVSSENHVLDKQRIRLVTEPNLCIYYLITVFKDKALCGKIISVYHMESVYPADDRKCETDVSLVGISWKRGERPIYYTDLNQIVLCLEYPNQDRQVNCPVCLDHPGYPLWALEKLEI